MCEGILWMASLTPSTLCDMTSVVMPHEFGVGGGSHNAKPEMYGALCKLSPRRPPAVVEHGAELFEEIVGIFKLAVDAGEADEGDFVEVAEVAHHQFAQLPALHFAFELLVDIVFDRGRGGFDLPAGDRALPA